MMLSYMYDNYQPCLFRIDAFKEAKDRTEFRTLIYVFGFPALHMSGMCICPTLVGIHAL